MSSIRKRKKRLKGILKKNGVLKNFIDQVRNKGKIHKVKNFKDLLLDEDCRYTISGYFEWPDKYEKYQAAHEEWLKFNNK